MKFSHVLIKIKMNHVFPVFSKIHLAFSVARKDIDMIIHQPMSHVKAEIL